MNFKHSYPSTPATRTQRATLWRRLVFSALLLMMLLSTSACISIVLPYIATPTPRPTTSTALLPTLDPVVSLQPIRGYASTYINVSGTGWLPGEVIVIYLEDEAGRSDVLASAIIDDGGAFSTGFLYPLAERWLQPGGQRVIASAVNQDIQAFTFFAVIPPANVATSTPTVTYTPSPVPTATTTPSPSPTPFPTEDPAQATARAIATLLTPEPTATATETPQPTVTPPPTDTPQPTVVIVQDWRGDYWTNPDLAGPPTLIRDDPVLDFNWGEGSPAPEIPADRFSARWTRTQFFDAGLYRFSVRVDDGARLYVDGQLILDEWRVGAAREVAVDYQMSQGEHTVVLEYYEEGQVALVRLQWEQIEQTVGWRGEYYTNRSLEGDPFFIRSDEEIDFSWGVESPMEGLPTERFSVRWQRTLEFDGGFYLFFAEADDGVRIWIDDALVIDAWHDQQAETHSAMVPLVPGEHQMRVEYYENTAGSQIRFWWQRGTHITLAPWLMPTEMGAANPPAS